MNKLDEVTNEPHDSKTNGNGFTYLCELCMSATDEYHELVHTPTAADLFVKASCTL